jgi:hypothetical protein
MVELQVGVQWALAAPCVTFWAWFLLKFSDMYSSALFLGVYWSYTLAFNYQLGYENLQETLPPPASEESVVEEGSAAETSDAATAKTDTAEGGEGGAVTDEAAAAEKPVAENGVESEPATISGAEAPTDGDAPTPAGNADSEAGEGAAEGAADGEPPTEGEAAIAVEPDDSAAEARPELMLALDTLDVLESRLMEMATAVSPSPAEGEEGGGAVDVTQSEEFRLARDAVLGARLEFVEQIKIEEEALEEESKDKEFLETVELFEKSKADAAEAEDGKQDDHSAALEEVRWTSALDPAHPSFFLLTFLLTLLWFKCSLLCVLAARRGELALR